MGGDGRDMQLAFLNTVASLVCAAVVREAKHAHPHVQAKHLMQMLVDCAGETSFADFGLPSAGIDHLPTIRLR